MASMAAIVDFSLKQFSLFLSTSHRKKTKKKKKKKKQKKKKKKKKQTKNLKHIFKGAAVMTMLAFR